FSQLMLEGRQPTINGDGEQQRDFLYVADAVSANLAALSKGSGQAYNLGVGEPTSVNQIFDLLGQLTGFTGQRRHGPSKAGEVYRIYLDASKARRELGWQARVSLEDGLRETVEYFRRQGEG